MRKQVFIFLLICIQFSSRSQTIITSSVPCSDSLAYTTKGRWIKTADRGSYATKEAYARLDKIHNMLLKIYPQPTGVDAEWHRVNGKSYFGAKRKYRTSDDGYKTDFDYFNEPHFILFDYTVGLFGYICEYQKTHSLIREGETGTWLGISANRSLGENSTDDTWTINDLPVIMRKPPAEVKDGLEISYPEPGSNARHILVHRKGTLPYKTVSRKIYLEYCISYYTKLHDAVIKGFEQMPVRSLADQEKEKNAKLAKLEKQFANDPKKLKANVEYYLSGYQTDQQIRDEKVQKAKRDRDDIIKKFTDEMEKSGNEGLLETPAMVYTKYQYSPTVFETDPEKGLLIITENPDYIRKELPKYVPQFFTVSLGWNDWEPKKKFVDIFLKDFPFTELQAMIDK